ncbi:glycosyltransferase family 4 protein [Sphingomonas sp. HH69]
MGRWVAARLAGGDAVAVSSAAARADYGLGARQKRDRAEVIPYGVEPSRVARLAGPRSPFRILFAGGMDQRAGADLLPAIFEKAQSRSGRKDVEVTLCGRGPLERRLRERLRLEVREWRFFFVRSIPHLVDTLSQYDAVLMPSRSEGLSLLPIQVLLARVPLIAARAPGLEDVVTSDYRLTAAIDDVDALADCLVTVLGQDLTFVGSALRARVARRFDITTMARSYEARYRTLAARRKGGQG